MGTVITLDVEGAALTYAKNHRGMDHGSLFQDKDITTIRSDQISYDWYVENEEDPAASEMAFVRKLKDLLPRLELLGFTIDRAREEYDSVAQEWLEMIQDIQEDDYANPDLMSFDEFRGLIEENPISSLDSSFVSGFDEESQKRIIGRFADLPLERVPHYQSHDTQAYSERTFFVDLINILHPYSVLRLLVPTNESAKVVWQFGPLVQAGWAQQSNFVPNARREQTFLLATEGSSDVHILKHALTLMRPGIMDFFRFIDVSESHPFSGTGNLVKFAEGLAKIDVHNQIVFVFDNDAEGLDAMRRVLELDLPSNMRAVMLPEQQEFNSFPAVGPEGLHEANINQRAAAIECYLDLSIGPEGQARVRWTNYKKSVGVYQGSLESKGNFTKRFLKQKAKDFAGRTYNFEKLDALLTAIERECIAIAEAQNVGMSLID